MDNISYIALSAQISLRRQIDTIANNVANVNTQGFRAESVRFREFVQQTDQGKFNRISYTDEIGKIRDTSIGNIEYTNNDLDFAINGEGYFQVETDQGLRYTRHGKFTLNEQGEVTTSAGHHLLQNGGGRIAIPVETGPFEVSPNGQITTENGDVLATVGLVKFQNDGNLIRTEDNLYIANELPEPVETPNIINGALEGSNVQSVAQITKLINAHHSHSFIASLINNESSRQSNLIESLAGRQ